MGASGLMIFIKGALMRVLVHGCSVVAAMCITLSEHSVGAFAGFLEFLCAYTGLVLLCRPAFDGIRRSIFLIPLLFGIIEVFVCLYFGMAPGASVISGGLVTFVSRRLIYGRKNLSELLILPLLIFLAIALSPSFYQVFYLNQGHITIPGAIAFCYSVLLVALGIEKSVRLRTACFKAQSDLLYLSARVPKVELSDNLRRLAELSEHLLKIAPVVKADISPFKETIKLVASVNTLFGFKSENSTGFCGKNNQEQSNTASLHQAINLSSLDASVKLLIRELEDTIRKLDNRNEDSRDHSSEKKQSKYPQFDESLARLLSLANEDKALADEIKKPLISILKSAAHLINVLNSTSEANAPLEAFLRRYLTKTESIVADYLSFRRVDDGSCQELVARIISILDRLAKAFKNECEDLKKSRADEFEAELKAFEEFMRMNGK